MTYTEQLEACQMPEDNLDGYSTDDLANLVLEYPFLIDVLAFDNAELAITHLSDVSNICQEFFSRTDALDVLLDKYDDLSVNYDMLNSPQSRNAKSSVATDSGYVKELFLQTYFADKAKSLSQEDTERLKDIIGRVRKKLCK